MQVIKHACTKKIAEKPFEFIKVYKKSMTLQIISFPLLALV